MTARKKSKEKPFKKLFSETIYNIDLHDPKQTAKFLKAAIKEYEKSGFANLFWLCIKTITTYNPDGWGKKARK